MKCGRGEYEFYARKSYPTSVRSKDLLYIDFGAFSGDGAAKNNCTFRPVVWN